MNPIIILLIIIILLVLFYLVYKAIFPTTTGLNAVANLGSGSTTIQITDGQPKAVNVSYAVWVYVNSWNNTQKIIFSRNGDVGLYLDNNTPTLYCDVAVAPSANVTGDNTINMKDNVIGAKTGGTFASRTITVSNNFPIQKWVYVIISMDGTGFTDVYLDGKLVKSIKMDIRPNLPDEKTAITLGGGQPFDAYLSKFVRYLYTMDPQTAWNLYLYGNGTGLSQYNVDIAVTKNGVVQSDMKIF